MTPNERPTPLTDAMLDVNGIRCACSEKPIELCFELEQMLAERTEERDTAEEARKTISDAMAKKLAKCRTAAELIIRVDSNTASENAEDGLPDIHDIAEQILEETK